MRNLFLVNRQQFHGLQNENHNHRKLTKMMTWITYQWNYKPRSAGPPKMDGAWWRVLTKRGALQKGMANHFSALASRTPWTVWQGKEIWQWTMSSPGQEVSNMLLGKRGETAPGKMNKLGQSGNKAKLWMCLMVKVNSNAVRTILHRKFEILGPWIKVNQMWLSRKWQEWIMTF